MEWRVLNIIERDSRSCMHREFRKANLPLCKAASNVTDDCTEENCPIKIKQLKNDTN